MGFADRPDGCTCTDCPACGAAHMVCPVCKECTRCSHHKPNCKGCPAPTTQDPDIRLLFENAKKDRAKLENLKFNFWTLVIILGFVLMIAL